MNSLKKFNESDLIEKLFLISIIFLPISLIIGSAIINSNIIGLSAGGNYQCQSTFGS